MPEEYRDHTHIGREIVDSLDEHFEKQANDPLNLAGDESTPVEEPREVENAETNETETINELAEETKR